MSLLRRSILIACTAVLLPWFLPAVLSPPLHEVTVDTLEPGSTIIITGANSGLGFATAQHFAATTSPNITIILACRNTEKCEDAKDLISSSSLATLVPMHLDLASADSIDRFCQQFDELKPIHILVNNAGILGATTNHDDPLETLMRVNYLGHFRLIHGLWHNLALGKGRIVMVSSLLGLIPLNTLKGWYPETNFQTTLGDPIRQWVQYARSKRAILLLAWELTRRGRLSQDSGVTVTASHPGYSRTPITLKAWGHTWWGRFLGWNTVGSMSAEQGAWTQIQAALMDHNCMYVGPKWVLSGSPVCLGTSSGAWYHWPLSNRESEALWYQSLHATGIQDFGGVATRAS